MLVKVLIDVSGNRDVTITLSDEVFFKPCGLEKWNSYVNSCVEKIFFEHITNDLTDRIQSKLSRYLEELINKKEAIYTGNESISFQVDGKNWKKECSYTPFSMQNCGSCNYSYKQQDDHEKSLSWYCTLALNDIGGLEFKSDIKKSDFNLDRFKYFDFLIDPDGVCTRFCHANLKQEAI